MSWHYQVNLDTLDRVYLFSIKIICRQRRPDGKLIHARKKLKGRQRFTQVPDVRRNYWELGEEIQRQFLWSVLIWVQALAWWWVIGSVYYVSATNTPESCWLILDYMLHLFDLGELVYNTQVDLYGIKIQRINTFQRNRSSTDHQTFI